MIPKPDTIECLPGFLAQGDIVAHWARLFPSTEDLNDPPLIPDKGKGLNPASVDLHLGSEFFVKSKDRPVRLTNDDPYLTIPSGEFALLMTWEVVHIPQNILALITMKVRHKQAGLINISGFHVDPGFHGQIFYSVYNAGPSNIKLKLQEPVFTIFFATLGGIPEPYQGDHQGQRALPAALVQAIGSPPTSLVELTRRLDFMENTLRIGAAFAVGILIPVAGLAGFLLSQVLK
jgi:dCTP deaminase